MRTILALGVLLFACQVARAETALYFNSSPGDYIGGGQQRFHAPPQVTFSVSGNSSNSVVSFAVTNFNTSPSIWWYLNLAAPNGTPLVPGTYKNAVRYPFQSSTQVGLSFSGEGRGCNTLAGEFTVLEAVYGSGGSVVSFAADFIQHCEGGASALYGGIRYNSTVSNPTPALSSISPANVPAGSDVIITVNGSNFITGSYVQLNGRGRSTTFLSSTQMTAPISGSEILQAGAAGLTVFNPGQGGGQSNSLTVSVINPVPTLSSISPASVTAGGTAFTLTVTGTGFIDGSTVQWNGSGRNTSFVSSTRLTAAILATDISNVGTVQVSVTNPSPGGGISNVLSLNIVNPAPLITSISPTTAIAGGEAFLLTVNGSNFLPGSTVQWNQTNRTTGFVNSGQLTATISVSDISAVTNAQISVVNPSPGGGRSGSIVFSVVNPPPIITSLVPTSVTAGGPAFALTIKGLNFLPGSVVRWNGSSRPTIVSSTQLVAVILSGDIVNAGTVQITAFNPAPGGGVSNSLGFNIDPAGGNSYPYSYYFPQLAVGGGWQTTLTYVNYSPQTVACQTTFLTDSAAPLLVPFDGVSAGNRMDTLPPGATLHKESNAAADAAVAGGWAQAQCTGPIKASVLYRSYRQGIPQAEAGVNASTTPATKFATFATHLTGLAYANPSTQPASISFVAIDSAGVKAGAVNLTLPAGTHGARFVGELLGLQNFNGSIQVVSTIPIVVLSLNFEAAPIFSALPSGDLDSSTPLSGFQ